MNYLITLGISLAVVVGGWFGYQQVEPTQNFGLAVLTVPQGGTGNASFTAGECLKGNGSGALTSGACGGSSSNAFEVATTSDIAVPQVVYISKTSGRTTLASTATTTLSGTANQISLSNSPVVIGAAGAVLTLPSHVVFPSSFQVTSATSTHATTTNMDITGLLTFNGVSATTWAAFCTTITGGAGLCDGSDATGSGGAAAVATSSAETSTYVPFWTSTAGTPATLSGGESTFAYDSTLNKLTVSNASTTQLSVSDVTSALVLTNAAGTLAEYTGIDCTNQFVRDVSALGAGTCATIVAADVDLADLTAGDTSLTFSGAYDGQTARTIVLNVGNANTWTALQTFGNASTTRLTISGAGTTTTALGNIETFGMLGIGSTATTTIRGNSATSTFSNAVSASGLQATTWLDADFLTSALILTGAGGDFAEYAGTSCTNQFVRSLSALGVATCATVTSSDVDSTITPSSRTLTVAGTANQITSSAGAQDLSANRTWTLSLPSHVVFPGNFQATNSTTTNATTTGSFYSSNKTFLETITSAIALTGADGLVAEYTGTTCTNQVMTVLSALGVATCSSINNDYWSGADLTVANGGTGVSTFTSSQLLYGNGTNALSSVATGTVSAGTGISISATIYALLNAASIAIDQAANLVWTGSHDFGGATSLEIPNGTAPTVNAVGEIALDTTSGNLVLATSTNATSVVFGGATTTLYAFSIASTSPDFASGGIIEMPAHWLPQTAIGVICDADAGTSVVINLSDGTNDTNTVTCTTTETQFAFTSNNSWTAYENIRLEVGTVTGSVDYLKMRFIGYRSTD